MSLITNLKKNFGIELKAAFWYTLGNFFLKGIALIMLPIYTRLLSVYEYGQYSIYNTWLSMLAIVVGLSLGSSIGIAKRDFKNDYEKYISSILFLSIIVLVAFFILFIMFGRYISNVTMLPPTVNMVLLLNSFNMFVISFFDIKLTFDFKYKVSLAISILMSVLSSFLSILLIINLNSTKYLGIVFGGFFVSLIISLAILIRILTKEKHYVNKIYWQYGLKYSIPMIPNNLALIFLNQIDRIMLAKIHNESLVAIYSVSYNLGTIVSIVWSGFLKSWKPWFYDNLSKGNTKIISHKTKQIIQILGIVIVLYLLVFPEILKIMVPFEYWDGINMVPIIVFGHYFSFIFSLMTNYEYYYKKTSMILIGTLLAGAINIILNILFIPKYGYIAAALTTLISYMFLFVFHYVIYLRIRKENVFRFKDIFYNTVIIGLFIGCYYLVIGDIVVRYILFVMLIIILIYLTFNHINLSNYGNSER